MLAQISGMRTSQNEDDSFQESLSFESANNFVIQSLSKKSNIFQTQAEPKISKLVDPSVKKKGGIWNHLK